MLGPLARWFVFINLVAPATGAACDVQVVDPVAAAQPAARSKDLMRAMKEAAQGIGMRGGREVSSSTAGHGS
jgi:hypothetical protein